jgi:hypothetical protein
MTADERGGGAAGGIPDVLFLQPSAHPAPDASVLDVEVSWTRLRERLREIVVSTKRGITCDLTNV